VSLLKGYKPNEAGFGQQYTDHLTKRTKVGEWFLFTRIIPNTLSKLRGKVVDFGCGVGEILKRCPQGSIGLELNKTSVEYCNKLGLDVRDYDPDTDRYRLAAVEPNVYGTFLMSHVLEHIPDTANVLRAILASCHRLAIGRVVIKVPGALMYKKDKTHVTFVDRAFLRDNDLLATEGFAVSEISYYPFNAEWIGRYSLVHETLVVYDRR
jgi:SAM-dependent methyltransferase